MGTFRVGSAASTSQIAELAARIAANTKKVDNYLATHSLATPSFDVDAPVQPLIPKTEADVLAARDAVIQDTLELRQLMLGPREQLLSYQPNQLLNQLVTARFELAHHVPIDGEATFADIASAAGLGEAHHIFCEPRPGIVTHSAVSRLLVEDPGLAAWVRWCTDDCWLAAYHTCEAMKRWPGSEEPHETGFALANQTNVSLLDFLAAHPERTVRFAAGMRLYAASPGLEVSRIVDAWPWGELPKGATVVDVGGSHGEATIALARAFPSLYLVVQGVDAQAIRDSDARKPADVADRVRFMTHDFFTEQPVRGADVYLFRACFHNWSDKYGVRMLQALIPALKPGARVVINDVVVPGPQDLPPGLAPGIRGGDLNMAILFNARDREMSDWARLFETASPGYQFEGEKRPPGSGLSVMAALWHGSDL
ncbi:S-adenosyl-L-methionine-dependent methyltransferase [Thozetella sp. PMI_491]|nr:S-adenosyl-L-methionine-dependent methyltransferase [Thozetella sp. PMI_491]